MRKEGVPTLQGSRTPTTTQTQAATSSQPSSFFSCLLVLLALLGSVLGELGSSPRRHQHGQDSLRFLGVQGDSFPSVSTLPLAAGSVNRVSRIAFLRYLGAMSSEESPDPRSLPLRQGVPLICRLVCWLVCHHSKDAGFRQEPEDS